MLYDLHFYLVIFFVRMASQATASSANSKEVPKFGKDPFWKHGEKVGVRVRRKFCDHKVSGGISCLKQHLAYERENCLPCTKVPDDVKAKTCLALETNRLSEAKKQKLQIKRDEVIIGDDNCLFPRSSTSSNKGPMDRHVHTQALPKNKGKAEKV